MFKFLVVGLFVGLACSDYCDPSLCQGSSFKQHIACGNSGDFSPSCPPDRKLVSLSKDNIQMILKKHNTLRNKVAMGAQKGFPTASRMASMVNFYRKYFKTFPNTRKLNFRLGMTSWPASLL